MKLFTPLLLLTVTLFSQDNTYEIKKNMSFAVTKYRQKQFRSAMNYFEKVFELDPDFSVAPVSILDKQARCYKELGLNDSATIAYEKLNKLDPGNEVAQKNIEYKYVKNEDFSKAAELSKRSAVEHPDEPEHWRDAGNYLFRENNFKKNMDDILSCYQKYFFKKNDPETIKKIISISQSKLTDKQFDIVINIFESIVKNGSENTDIIKALAKKYIDHDTEKLDTAVKYLTTIEKKIPEDVKVKQLLVEAYTNSKNFDKALAYSEKILNINDLDYPYNDYDTFSRLCIELNKFGQARNKVYNGMLKYNDLSFRKILANIYKASASSGNRDIMYDDKLVFLISFGLYDECNETSVTSKFKVNGLLPSRSEYFVNKDKFYPTAEKYLWIKKDWKEVKYIETYLKGLLK
ncbi:MAG: hypothetical protein JXR69_00160 [Candidatus Delongbacteria bacterium]|nr:hypothetical protein [Candidatus Delongbacteria bacterium]